MDEDSTWYIMKDDLNKFELIHLEQNKDDLMKVIKQKDDRINELEYTLESIASYIAGFRKSNEISESEVMEVLTKIGEVMAK